MVLLGIIVFTSGIILAYLGGQGYISGIDPLFVVPLSIILLIFFLCGAANVLMGDMGLKSDGLPKQRDPEILVRVLREEDSDFEVFIRGMKEDILRYVLLTDWPLNSKLKNQPWYVVDSIGNDITDNKFSEFEGTLTIRLRDV